MTSPAPFLPNFLLIGAAKAGTTSLWSYLAQHPEVFLPETKEPNYFAFPEQAPSAVGPAPAAVIHELLLKFSVTSWPAYTGLFAGSQGRRAVGEASVRYLYETDVPARIHACLPGVRLIAVLREPVARLHSHYWMNRQFHLEDLTLEEAIEAEPARRQAGFGYDWHYVAVGRYAEQLERYFTLFGRERVAVFLQEDLRREPSEVFRRACAFLGVSGTFEPDFSERAKEAFRPRWRRLDRWLQYPGPVRSAGFRLLGPEHFERLRTGLRRWNSAPIPPLDPGLRQRLKALFEDDVARLERLLGRELSAWR